MKRITLEEVTQAYLETGILPKRGSLINIIDNRNYCCGVGVICAKYLGVKETHTMGKASKWLKLNYNDDYINGFFMGFDGSDYPYSNIIDQSICDIGIEDGKNIAKKIFGE